MSRTARIDLGGVELDPANECLWRDGEAIGLRPKVYRVLLYLVENPGRIVTKDELLETVWADTVVGDAVLKVCVRELRAALGDSTQEPRFIATVHRRGYRYVGQSQGIEPGGPGGAEGPSASLPGIAGEPPSGAISGPISGPDSAPAVGDPAGFVARSRERAALDEGLRSCVSGSRRMVSVSGPPGIGKSALVDAALAQWRSVRGIRIVRGRCQEISGAKEAYLPFLEAVGDLCSEPGHVELLRRIAPTWFVQFPWLLSGDDRTQLARELHGATAGRMLRELDAFLVELSRRGPIVMSLEDMHWSDADSVDLLAFLATRDASARLLIIATARPVELIVNDHPLRGALRDLRVRGVCAELPLELFSEDEVQALIEEHLRGATVPDSISRWLHARTEGHPLFVVHLLDHLVSAGHLVESEGQWSPATPLHQLVSLLPDSLPGIVDRNLERSSPGERTVLEGASLAGHHFTSAAVAHAIDGTVDDAEEVIDGLAERGEFVVALGTSELPDGTIAARYRFTHAILRDCLRRRISPSRRVRIQRRLGERGEALFGERSHEISAHLAEHFEDALIHDKAIHYRRSAAENSARRYASRGAVQHLRAALELIPKLPEERQGPERHGLELALAKSLRDSGDVAAAAVLFESLADKATDPEDAAALWLLGASARSWLDRSQCLRNVESALAVAATDERDALAAHVQGHAAYWRLLWNGWESGGRAASEAAVTSAVEGARPAHACTHRAQLAFFLALEARYPDAALAAEAAHAAALESGDVSESLLADFYRGWALLLGGEWNGAERHVSRALGEATTNGHGPWGVLFGILLAWLELEKSAAAQLAGGGADPPVSDALELARGAFRGAEPFDNPFIKGFATGVLALALVNVGELAEARSALDDLTAQAREGRFLMDWLCELLGSLAGARLGLATGDHGAAAAAAEGLVAQASVMGESTLIAMAHSLKAEAKLQGGDRRGARAASNRALSVEATSPLALWRVHATAAELDRPSNAERSGEHRAKAIEIAKSLLR